MFFGWINKILLIKFKFFNKIVYISLLKLFCVINLNFFLGIVYLLFILVIILSVIVNKNFER